MIGRDGLVKSWEGESDSLCQEKRTARTLSGYKRNEVGGGQRASRGTEILSPERHGAWSGKQGVARRGEKTGVGSWGCCHSNRGKLKRNLVRENGGGGGHHKIFACLGNLWRKKPGRQIQKKYIKKKKTPRQNGEMGQAAQCPVRLKKKKGELRSCRTERKKVRGRKIKVLGNIEKHVVVSGPRTR